MLKIFLYDRWNVCDFLMIFWLKKREIISSEGSLLSICINFTAIKKKLKPYAVNNYFFVWYLIVLTLSYLDVWHFLYGKVVYFNLIYYQSKNLQMSYFF